MPFCALPKSSNRAKRPSCSSGGCKPRASTFSSMNYVPPSFNQCGSSSSCGGPSTCGTSNVPGRKTSLFTNGLQTVFASTTTKGNKLSDAGCTAQKKSCGCGGKPRYWDAQNAASQRIIRNVPTPDGNCVTIKTPLN